MIFAALRVLGLLAAAPLVGGVVTRVKSRLAGRTGPPLLQPYLDLRRLLSKGAVLGHPTTWVFRAGPIVSLAAAAAATLLVPLGGGPALVAFPGDFLLLAGLLGLGRFATALAALDTGSSFEGMGAAREIAFGAFAEPALLLGLVVLARAAGSASLSGVLGPGLAASWPIAGPALLLATLALFAVALAEGSRLPVDDPETHLELTMIHEVMVLDHSGPDLAFVGAAAHLRLAILGALVSRLALGAAPPGLLPSPVALGAGLLAFAVAVGVVESTTARLRLTRVPQFLVAASVLSVLALVLLLR